MATADSLAIEASQNYEDAKNLANNALVATDAALNNAAAAVGGLSVNWGILTGDPADVAVNDGRIALPGYLPSYDYTNEVKAAFEDKFDQLNGDLAPHILNYLETFFPDISEAIKTDSDAWIIDTIANGKYVPASVEDAIYQRARDQEIRESQRAETSVIEATASRGFLVPNGVMSYTIAVIQQETSKRLASLDRDIAIKAFDIANENTKFAIQQAVSLRTAFVAALGDFIRLANQQPNQAIDYAKMILTSKNSVHDNAMRYYQGRLEEEKLRTATGFGNLQALQSYNELFVRGRSSMMDAEIRIANVKADTATKAADTLARVASGALATRNSMISVSAGV